jgi:hypothetical protein
MGERPESEDAQRLPVPASRRYGFYSARVNGTEIFSKMLRPGSSA